jgi:hypothetical protein
MSRSENHYFRLLYRLYTTLVDFLSTLAAVSPVLERFPTLGGLLEFWLARAKWHCPA